MSMAYGMGFGDGENMPGIPLAPIGRRHLQASDYDYIERKRQLASRLPIYTGEEIARRKNPFFIVLLHEMLQEGYQSAVRELAQIFRREDKLIDKSGVSQFAKLIAQQRKVYMMADILRASEEYEAEGLFETASVIRRELGQKLMKEKDTTLAKHFLRMALLISEKVEVKSATLDRLQAEIHCLLAFIARENTNLETALDSAVNHLAVCRELSKDQSWHFPPHVLSIRIKKPIALHGLRDEYEEIDACSMSLYMIATLLEHEMMLGLANQILHSHRYPSDQDVAQAHVFADTALRLAFEVHQSVALSSALLRFGIILRHAGEYADAIKYFKQLSNHSEVSGDNETFAIAQHNIAMSHIAKHESMEALECLTKQKEIADSSGIMDLQADALEELGLILLQEGQLWEAEECYASAYECFQSIENQKSLTSYRNHCERTFGMCGIAAGQQLWSRFAGLIRTDTYETISGLIDWKSRRSPLPKVPRPDYTPDRISDVYVPYHLETDLEAEEEGEDADEDEGSSPLLTIPSAVEVQRSHVSLAVDVDPKRGSRTSSIASVTSHSHLKVNLVDAKSSTSVQLGKGFMSDFHHSPDDIKELEEIKHSRVSVKPKKSRHEKHDQDKDKVHHRHEHRRRRDQLGSGSSLGSVQSHNSAGSHAHSHRHRGRTDSVISTAAQAEVIENTKEDTKEDTKEEVED